MNTYFSLPCPECGRGIGFFRVKPKFSCPNCHSSLQANCKSANSIVGLSYLVAAPLFWFLLFLAGHFAHVKLGYDDWVNYTLLMSVIFYLLVYPRLLRIERKRNEIPRSQ